MNQGNSIVSLQNRMFSVFLVLFVPRMFSITSFSARVNFYLRLIVTSAVLMNQVILKMFSFRGLWEGRERPARIYGPVAFCTSFALSDVPYAVVCGVLYFVIWYSMGPFSFFPTFNKVRLTMAIVDLPRELGTIAYSLFFIFVFSWGLFFSLTMRCIAFGMVQLFFLFQVWRRQSGPTLERFN
jgi:ABC-type multidrug transport system permease subunit